MVIFQKKILLKVLQSKAFIWTAIFTFITGVFICVYFSGKSDLVIFPNQQKFSYDFYCDSAAGGDSKIIAKVISDTLINLDFQIGSKISSPYAGISIGPKVKKAIDAGYYNQLVLKLKGSEMNGIGIALVTDNSLKKGERENREILFYHIFKISSGIRTYKISMDKFGVPDWWGEYNKIEDASSLKPNLKSLGTINLSSAFTPISGKTQSLNLYSLAFSRDNSNLIRLLISFGAAIILATFLILSTLEIIQNSKKSIIISYKAVENDPASPSKTGFIAFINENFRNSSLTLDLISKETGVSQRKIATDIQNQFACNFKTYLNRLRINESKRLLLETDLNVGEIAFMVGFNNQSHFNRVFKSEQTISPTEYRLNKQK